MDILPEISIVGIVVLVVFLARTLESAMGFGGTILALPTLAILAPQLPIRTTLVPMLALGGIVSCIGIVWLGRGEVVWGHYFKILAWMLPGLPLGFVIAGYASEMLLRLVLGIFVLLIAIISLVRISHQRHADNPQRGIRKLLLRAMLVGGGTIHGMFTTGGPLVVVYATRVLHTKGLFRVTLALVWLTLTPFLVGGWIADGRIAPEAWPLAAISIPFVMLAVAVGDRLHHRLPEAAFRKTAYVLLIVAGISLIHKSLPLLVQTVGS